MNAYKEGKNAASEVVEEHREGTISGRDATVALLASGVWALLDIAESLDNIRQNGIVVETCVSANQPF